MKQSSMYCINITISASIHCGVKLHGTKIVGCCANFFATTNIRNTKYTLLYTVYYMVYIHYIQVTIHNTFYQTHYTSTQCNKLLCKLCNLCGSTHSAAANSQPDGVVISGHVTSTKLSYWLLASHVTKIKPSDWL